MTFDCHPARWPSFSIWSNVPAASSSKQSLMDVAWKDAHVSETSLTEAIGLIRQALGDDPQKPTFIQTVHRRGYRFVAPITAEAQPTIASPRSDDSQPRTPLGVTQESAAAMMASSHRSRWAMVTGIGAVGLLATIAGILVLTARRPSQPEQTVRVNVAFAVEQAPIPSLNAIRSSRSRLTGSAWSMWAERRPGRDCS